MAIDDHEFGSQSTDLKLEIVEGYLRAFTTALSGKWPQLWYIDAFAGTGSRTQRTAARDGDLFDEPVSERVEQRRGSARIALDVTPPFSRLIFMESNPRHCEALRLLKASHTTREIDIVEGDANKAIQNEIDWDGWKNVRAVMFLDPYGMDVEWDTLKAIANTHAIDVWYLFSLSGLYRQAAKNSRSIDEHKRMAITKMLGTEDWEKELYSPSAQSEMFEDAASLKRAANVKGLERYVRGRLKTIFAEVLEPLALPVDRGPQMFSLFFAISNPNPKAVGLARKIAGHILTSGKLSQNRPR
jgi:three-Cys-motif partner protein